MRRLLSKRVANSLCSRSQSTLRSHWPKLRRQLDAIQNENGVIPLLPSNHQSVVDRKTSVSDKTAAVLVLLVMVDEVPSLVFTQRSSHLSQHAAQISFPGGHYEDQDSSLVETAIREAKEELYPQQTQADSVDWQDLAILGTATVVPSIRGVPVTPILAGLLDSSFSRPMLSNMWPGNPTEVDFVFCASVRELLLYESTRELRATAYNPPNPTAPIFRVRHGNRDDDLIIWGLTAYVLQPLLHNLFLPVFYPGGLEGEK